MRAGPAAKAAFAMFHGNEVHGANISLAALLPRPENAEHPSVIWRNAVLVPRMAANRAEAARLNAERGFIPSSNANARRYNRDRRRAASFERCGFCPNGRVAKESTPTGDMFVCGSCFFQKRAPKAGAK